MLKNVKHLHHKRQNSQTANNLAAVQQILNAELKPITNAQEFLQTKFLDNSKQPKK